MTQGQVLILDDDQALAQSLAREFEDHGFSAVVVQTIDQIPERSFKYAVVDLRLRGEIGLDSIELILKISPDCRVAILSGYGSINTAVEAMRRGAIDYLTKPASFAVILAALQGSRQSVLAAEKPLSLSQIEHEHIDFVLTKNQGNISKTAKELGLHRQSLQRKLKKYT